MEQSQQNKKTKKETPQWDGEYTWTLNAYSRRKEEEKIYSDTFEIAEYKWRLLLFPKGIRRSGGFQSLYLDFVEADSTPAQSWPYASFELSCVNHILLDGTKRQASNTFGIERRDWGYTNFVPLDDNKESTRGFVKEDSITYEVKIRLHNTRTGESLPKPEKPSTKSDENLRISVSVSGQLFHLEKQQLERYPESLLCKMMVQCPSLLEGKVLAIDRDPSLFEIIELIYSDGAYLKRACCIDPELIQETLDFYMMPMPTVLGFQIMPLVELERDIRRDMEDLVDDILREMHACGVNSKQIGSMVAYYKLHSHTMGERRIMIMPVHLSSPHDLVTKRGHAEFSNALFSGRKCRSCSHNKPGSLILRPDGVSQFFSIMKFSGNNRLNQLNKVAAEKMGDIRFEVVKYQLGSENERREIEMLRKYDQK